MGDTLNPINDARRSTATDRTTSHYNDAKEKVQKIYDLINMGKYDADLAKYIPGLLDLAIQGMLEDINTREKTAHPILQRQGADRLSNPVERKLLCKSKQHPPVLSY